MYFTQHYRGEIMCHSNLRLFPFDSVRVPITLGAFAIVFDHVLSTGTFCTGLAAIASLLGYAHVCVHVLKELVLLRASHSGEITLAVSRRLRSMLAAAPVL